MASKDIYSNIGVAETLAPASRTASVNGTGVDLAGYESAAVVIERGAAGGTTPSFTFEVQESDDNATFTAVAGANLQGTEPVVTAAGAPVMIGYLGAKRYIRAAITAASGTSPTLLCSAIVVRSNARDKPVA